MSEVTLAVTDLHAGYDGVTVLRGVTMHARASEIVSIIGPNGAGKSTFLKAVAGIVRPTSGSVVFRGDDVTGYRRSAHAARPRLRAALDNVFPTLTVSENLRVGAQAIPRGDRNEAVAAVVELDPASRDRRRQRAGRSREVSGSSSRSAVRSSAGPRCCSSTSRPPGSHRRPWTRVFSELERIRDRGIGIVIVEQNARRALALSNRGYVLDMGRNAHEGAGADLLVDPLVAELYLGSMTSASIRREPG